jgi:hypothetical protein
MCLTNCFNLHQRAFLGRLYFWDRFHDFCCSFGGVRQHCFQLDEVMIPTFYFGECSGLGVLNTLLILSESKQSGRFSIDLISSVQ